MVQRFSLPGGLELCGLGVQIKKERTLVIADLHIGYEDALLEKGFLVHKTHTRLISQELIRLLDDVAPKRVVVAGDLKHDFGSISGTEWRDSRRIIDILSEGRELVLLQGNHDSLLGPIANKLGIVVRQSFRCGGCLVMHGDKVPCTSLASFNTLIVGHEHPAVSVRHGARVERFKSFVVGKYQGLRIVILPSYNPLVEGSTVQEGYIGPFLPKTKSRRWLVCGDRFYSFTDAQLRQLNL